MGKGADSPNIPDQTTTVQQSLPAYAEPFYRELMGRAVYEASTPYQAFPGQRLADFNTAETQAMQGIGGLERPEQIGQASQFATQGVQAAANPYQAAYDPAADLGPGFQPGTMADMSTIQQYMDPYQQLVTDIEKREAARQSNIMGSQIGQRAATQGSLGGYREAIMQAERERNLGQQLGDIQARGSQQAFGQAQQAFEADRQRRLQAAQLGLDIGRTREGFEQAAEQFGQGAFGLNLDAGRQQLAGAELLGSLGAQQQQMDLQRLQSQQAAGQVQRELQQRGLDIGYQDFLRQQAFPREQLGMFSSLLQGLPIAPGSTQATFGQQPTAEQQLLGSGIAGVGLYNALRGQA